MTPPRAATKHSMSRRCLGWDYRQPCIYQITLVLADRRSEALGRLELGAPAPSTRQPPGSVLEAAASSRVALSPLGEAVEKEFYAVGAHHPGIKPLAIAVMPDHVHFLVRVTRPLGKPLGHAIGGFKAGSSKAATGAGGLWAEGFQDTILFHEGQLAAMFNYLRDNPRRLATKRLLPDLFRVRRDLRVDLGLPPQAHDKGAPPLEPGAAGETDGFAAHFAAIGNHFLLNAPSILQVQCSRSLCAYKRLPQAGGGQKIARDAQGAPIIERSTQGFAEKRDALLAAAKHGAVLLSPCISDGEREIARLAFAAGASVIALRNMGFSPLYKPGGKLFDQTANGKLLLLAPAAWPHSPAAKPMTRQDACVLNRVAQLLAGAGAAAINYQGMTPANVDCLVRAALSPAAPYSQQ